MLEVWDKPIYVKDRVSLNGIPNYPSNTLVEEVISCSSIGRFGSTIAWLKVKVGWLLSLAKT